MADERLSDAELDQREFDLSRGIRPPLESVAILLATARRERPQVERINMLMSQLTDRSDDLARYLAIEEAARAYLGLLGGTPPADGWKPYQAALDALTTALAIPSGEKEKP